MAVVLTDQPIRVFLLKKTHVIFEILMFHLVKVPGAEYSINREEMFNIRTNVILLENANSK